MSELLLDTSEIIFTIDKPAISFHINPNSNIIKLTKSQIIDHSPKSESKIKITNLMSNDICLRVRTTKKNYYAVNPNYCIIPPNSNKTINFLLYLKDNYLNMDFSHHKFRFEGFLIEENNRMNDPKKIFENVIKNKIQVKGNIIKRICQIIEDENYIFSNDKVTNPNLSINFENNPLSQSINFSSLRSKNQNNNFKNIKNEKEEKLNSLKTEYYNLKNQIGILSQSYSNIKNTVENEKNKNNFRGKETKIIFNLPEIKEKKINYNIAILLCLLAFFFGYYLTK